MTCKEHFECESKATEIKKLITFSSNKLFDTKEKYILK